MTILDQPFPEQEWTDFWKSHEDTPAREKTFNRLHPHRRATSPAFFSDDLAVAQKFAGQGGTVYKVEMPKSVAMQNYSGNQMVKGGTWSSNFKFQPEDMLEMAQKGKIDTISGPGKVVGTSGKPLVAATGTTPSAIRALNLAKGVVAGGVGGLVGSYVAPHILAPLTGKTPEKVSSDAVVGANWVGQKLRDVTGVSPEDVTQHLPGTDAYAKKKSSQGINAEIDRLQQQAGGTPTLSSQRNEYLDKTYDEDLNKKKED
tara:strand:+ start:65 stop:838 length:774 start_codon:yes stop_codon:yes gene_type:complete